MLIDMHTHIWRYPGHLSDELHEEANRMRSEPRSWDAPPEAHRAAMSAADRVIVFGLRAPHTGIDVPNDFIADYVRSDPAKLIGFLSVDPYRDDVESEIERGVQALGLRGIKLGPTYQGYHPHDPKADPIFARASALNLPILLHQGATFPRKAELEQSRPILLEKIALKYPDLVMVIAHLGHPWEEETIVLIRKQPNLYADISALFYRPWQMYNSLRLAYEYGAMHKLLFGTDWPVAGIEETIEGLKKVCEMAQRANLPELPWEKIEEIIYRDSLSLLRLQ